MHPNHGEMPQKRSKRQFEVHGGTRDWCAYCFPVLHQTTAPGLKVQVFEMPYRQVTWDGNSDSSWFNDRTEGLSQDFSAPHNKRVGSEFV
jgi:hypothetical protein